MSDGRYWNAARGMWAIPVPMGQCRTSADPNAMLTTMLGSCVAACIWDPVRQIGGMNHILLPSSQLEPGEQANRFGNFAMECLTNLVMRWGGLRNELRVKLFGGASSFQSGFDVGMRNIESVTDYLAAEQMILVNTDVGGDWARRVEFFPTTGRARVMKLRNPSKVHRQESRHQVPAGPTDDGIELF